MILAGLALLGVGIADLVRQFLSGRTRWIAWAVGAIALVVLGAGTDAAVWAFVAVAVGAAWVVAVPADGSGRGGFWPVGVLAVLTAASVALLGGRVPTGPLAEAWSTSVGLGSIDHAVLVVGAVVFLLESANVVVRTALRGAAPGSADGAEPTLKGGRLIGPLERVLVFALTLAGAYTLIAAVLAAKGIVRFPEISRDTESGHRAEYFLVGSLVSWVVALAAALLTWWAGAIAAR